MTDKTPRTDEVMRPATTFYELAEHARTLERELADCRAELERKTIEAKDWKVLFTYEKQSRLASHAEREGVCNHERVKRLRAEYKGSAEWRTLPPGGKTQCWCCEQFVEVIGLARSFTICRPCWDAADPVIPSTEHKLNLGAFAPAPSATSELADEIEGMLTGKVAAWITNPGWQDVTNLMKRAAEALRSRPAQGRDAERWKRIELAYCRANDYINALISEHSIPLESLEKIRAAYWQAVKEV